MVDRDPPDTKGVQGTPPALRGAAEFFGGLKFDQMKMPGSKVFGANGLGGLELHELDSKMPWGSTSIDPNAPAPSGSPPKAPSTDLAHLVCGKEPAEVMRMVEEYQIPEAGAHRMYARMFEHAFRQMDFIGAYLVLTQTRVPVGAVRSYFPETMWGDLIKSQMGATVWPVTTAQIASLYALGQFFGIQRETLAALVIEVADMRERGGHVTMAQGIKNALLDVPVIHGEGAGNASVSTPAGSTGVQATAGAPAAEIAQACAALPKAKGSITQVILPGLATLDNFAQDAVMQALDMPIRAAMRVVAEYNIAPTIVRDMCCIMFHRAFDDYDFMSALAVFDEALLTADELHVQLGDYWNLFVADYGLRGAPPCEEQATCLLLLADALKVTHHTIGAMVLAAISAREKELDIGIANQIERAFSAAAEVFEEGESEHDTEVLREAELDLAPDADVPVASKALASAKPTAFRKHLRSLESESDPVKALELVATHEIPLEEAHPIFARKVLDALFDTDFATALNFLEVTQLPPEWVKERLASVSEGGLAAVIESKLGLKLDEIYGKAEPFYALLTLLEIPEDRAHAMILAAFNKNLKDNRALTARTIATEFKLDPALVRARYLQSIPNLIAAGEVRNAVALAQDYELVAEVLASSQYIPSLCLLLASKPTGGFWSSALGMLSDSGLLPPEIRTNQRVRQSVHLELIRIFNNGTQQNNQDVAGLVTVFEITRSELISQAIRRTCRFISTGDYTIAQSLTNSYGITKATAGYALVREAWRKEVAQLLREGLFELAEEVCRKEDIQKDELVDAGTSVAVEFFKRGDFHSLERVTRWLGIEESSVICSMAPQEFQLAFNDLIRRGYSFRLQMLTNYHGTAAAQFLRQVPESAVIDCIGAQIRACQFQHVDLMVQFYPTLEIDVEAIALRQVEVLLASERVLRAKNVIDKYTLHGEPLEKAALRAVVRAYQMADLERVTNILELVPSIRSAVDKPGLRSELDGVVSALTQSGWRAKLANHFLITFRMNEADCTPSAEDVRIGLCRLLEDNAFNGAISLVSRLNQEPELLVRAVFEGHYGDGAHKNAIAAFPDDIKEAFGKKPHEFLGEFGRKLVDEEFVSRINRDQIESADRLAMLFGLGTNAVDLAASKHFVDLLLVGNLEAAARFRALSGKVLNLGVTMAESLKAKLIEKYQVPDTVKTLHEVMYELARARKVAYIDASTVTQQKGFDVDKKLDAESLLKSAQAVRSPVPVSYRRQKTGHTCGPACGSMAIEAVTSVSYPEQQMARWLGTTEEIGTPLAFFSKLSTVFTDVEILVSTDATYGQMRDMMRSGYLIIMNYQIGIEPHYGIVSAVTDNAIVFDDPTAGANTAYLQSKVNWRGGYDDGRTQGGMVALRARGYGTFQDLPKPEKDEAAVVTRGGHRAAGKRHFSDYD